MKKLLLLLFLLIGCIAGGLFLLFRLTSTNDFSSTYESFQVVIEGEAVDKSQFDRVDGQYYFSTDLIKQYLDEDVEINSDTVLIENETGVKELKIGEEHFNLNGKKINLRDPLFEREGKVFLPIEAFIYDYPVKVRYNKDKNVLVMDYSNRDYAKAAPTGDGVNMREEASTQSPIVTTLSNDAELNVYDESNGWYLVREKIGYAGWIRGDNLKVASIDGQFIVQKDEKRKSAIEKPINVTWDYTYSQVKDSVISSIKPINGLDVIIPTWFSIKNESGDLIDRGKIEYTKAYNSIGVDVWGYVDNQFDPELTSKFLSNENGRKKAVDNLISSAKRYGMKGINVDFENTKIEDREGITLFVKELYEAAQDENLIISVCVTPQISNDVEKEPYDREALSQNSDYVILMAYDQHWGSSEKAGSVAEYKWVEGNINLSLRQIDQEKFILGVPFYSRLWKEGQDGLKSRPVGMTETKNYIDSQGLTPTWDEQAKQYFIETSRGNKTEKIWIEDSRSIEEKVSLVRKYNLAGVASWRLGFETKDIWETIRGELSNYDYIHK